jgi:16S rRNA G966 N2-methylase RsmD
MENASDFATNKRMKTILRLFPYLKNVERASKLLIDDESMKYISIREYAEKISDIIKLHLDLLGIPIKNANITDATAGVGGDTISFAKNFNHVYAIEIDKLRSEYLLNNVIVYDCANVSIIHDDCINVLNKIKDHNVIFIDPPWEPDGNGSYKQHDKLRLPFGNETIESLCNKLMNNTYMKKIPDIIALKLPKNYDIIHFYNSISNKQIHYYDLNKMIILVIVNKSNDPLVK